MAITSTPHQDRPTSGGTRLPLAALIILVILATIGVVLLARDALLGSSSSPELQGSGTAATSNVSIDGSGNAQLSGLAARYVDADVSGSGTIFVTATQRLDAKVPGSGAVLYGGNPPQVTTSITGSGAVTPG